MLPSVWKYVSYEYIIELADNFQAKPLTDNPNETQQALFRRKSVSQEDISTSRVFMDWRKAFVVFALMAGKLPSAEELQAYYDRLRAEHNAADSGLVTKEAFINIDAWYDRTEGAIVSKPVMSMCPSARSPASPVSLS